MQECKSIGCTSMLAEDQFADFCDTCARLSHGQEGSALGGEKPTLSLAQLYPKYFKDVRDLDELDVYMTHQLFQVDDCSGAIQHASKKLLLSGVRTGGKSKYDDIREARDTLNRWLQIHSPLPTSAQVDVA